MGLRRVLHTLICFLLALIATGAAYFWSERYYQNAQTVSGLAWSRQVSSQIDALALHAREKGESDPLAWAVGVLTQGQEPRMMRLYKIETGTSAGASETFGYEPALGVFDYSRLLEPERGRGVRVVIQLGYLGFLGTKTRAMSDLLILVCFGVTLVAVFFLSIWVFGLAGERRLKAIVSAWVLRAKLILNQFGSHIRELLRGEQMLMKSANECHGALRVLEMKIREQLVDLHELQRVHASQTDLTKRVETLTLSAVIESSRLGAGGKRVAEIVEELHRLVLRNQEMLKSSGGELGIAAKNLEVWASEVQSAAQMAVNIFGATQSIHTHLVGTTGTVMDQAKLMKALNLQLSQELSRGLRRKLEAEEESSGRSEA